MYIIMSGTCALVVPWHVSGFGYATDPMASQLIGGSATLQWTSFVCGYHVYCWEWTAAVGEVLSLKSQNTAVINSLLPL